MPTSTLWRTLEQQRIQSEEDDRWLEEEEEKLVFFLGNFFQNCIFFFEYLIFKFKRIGKKKDPSRHLRAVYSIYCP